MPHCCCAGFAAKILWLWSFIFGGGLLFYIFSKNKNEQIMVSYSGIEGDNDDESYYELNSMRPRSNCLKEPFLYVTVHDKTAKVLKYSRDGCLLSENILMVDGNSHLELDLDVDFRSMAIGTHNGDKDALFIADASEQNSRLLKFGKCNNGRRAFIEVVVDSKQNKGVDHIYGVTLDKKHNIYISNQNTDSVLRFHYKSYEPFELSKSLQLSGRLDYFPGTFVQFGLPNKHGQEDQGVRAIVNVKDKIWIVHEKLSGIAVADKDSGLVTNFFFLETPVGMYYDEYLAVVFITCKSKRKEGGVVYGITDNTFRIVRTYSHNRMSHPAGITSYNGLLYVADKNIGAILIFDIKTEQYIRQIASGHKKSLTGIEQILLSPC